ncbi:MAG: LmeA family phospholipid-binding protein [Streptosporangiaceae bacterium]
MTRTATPSMRGGRSGSRRARRWVITVVVIVAVLVGLDLGARAVAESVMASKIEQQGLPSKPDVAIDGFPFLTQVASRDFRRVTITASNVSAGPVTITTINAAASTIRLGSYAFSSGTIGSLSGTALISFASLGNTLTARFGALGSLLKGAGLQLTDAGPDEVRATLDLLVTSGSATWRVTLASGNTLVVSLVGSRGLPGPLLSSIQTLTLQIPKLPLGLTIDSVVVTPRGVIGAVRGHDVPFGN